MLLLLLSFLWGASYPLIRIAVRTIPPASTVAMRVVIGSGLLVLLWYRQNLRLPRSLSVWGRLFVQACLNITIPFTLISWGEQFIGGGLAGILNATPPVFVALLAWIGTRHEPLTVRKAVGVFLGIAGVLVIVGPSVLLDWRRYGLAELAILAASLCYALAAVGGHRLGTLPPLVSATGTVVCAAATMVPVSLIVEHPWNLTPSAQSLGAAVCLGVFSTSAAYIVYFRLLSLVGPLGTASGSYLRAGVAVLLGTLFLHETFTPSTAIGLGSVLAGVAILTTPISRGVCRVSVSSR
ncbi:MAG TPA: DMT family transporter [bacterium]|nr:DMT family transporter [bacterium]